MVRVEVVGCASDRAERRTPSWSLSSLAFGFPFGRVATPISIIQLPNNNAIDPYKKPKCTNGARRLCSKF
jgi:hypothetical protein